MIHTKTFNDIIVIALRYCLSIVWTSIVCTKARLAVSPSVSQAVSQSPLTGGIWKKKSVGLSTLARSVIWVNFCCMMHDAMHEWKSKHDENFAWMISWIQSRHSPTSDEIKEGTTVLCVAHCSFDTSFDTKKRRGMRNAWFWKHRIAWCIDKSRTSWPPGSNLRNT
jgi:hypothetical protein